MRFQGTSTSQVIGVRNEMIMDDHDGQMIFGDLGVLKVTDSLLTGEGKPRKNLTQETCPDQESNPGPLRGKRVRRAQLAKSTDLTSKLVPLGSFQIF